MRPIVLGHTLDLDSTVFCRYGEQAGSLKGHNPIKHRPSHPPLVAGLSERRRLLWATPGPVMPGRPTVREFLAQADDARRGIRWPWSGLGVLCDGIPGGLGRAGAPYIIVARLTPLVRKLVIHRIPEADWRSVVRGVAVADKMVSLPAWHGQVRRFVCLRQTLTERPTPADGG
ncbi:MAG: hypothetical protein IPP12_11795 [Nitrospira sp.]|nr:hypothetical protein [Nitrospira sp.]